MCASYDHLVPSLCCMWNNVLTKLSMSKSQNLLPYLTKRLCRCNYFKDYPGFSRWVHCIHRGPYKKGITEAKVILVPLIEAMIEPRSPAWQEDSLHSEPPGKPPKLKQVKYIKYFLLGSLLKFLWKLTYHDHKKKKN